MHTDAKPKINKALAYPNQGPEEQKEFYTMTKWDLSQERNAGLPSENQFVKYSLSIKIKNKNHTLN